jgi:two-component system, OmpR family, response regulator
MKNILLIEKNITFAKELKDSLNKSGYTVMLVTQASQAIPIDITKFDLVVLDSQINSENSIELLKHWRSQGASTPILLLTSKNEIKSGNGADDYIDKFQEREELSVKINKLINRPDYINLSQVNSIMFDRDNKVFMENKKVINFTRSEFEILRYFFNNSNRIITKQELINYLYKNNQKPKSNVIERHIKSIRSKLNSNPFLTMRSVGYRLKV